MHLERVPAPAYDHTCPPPNQPHRHRPQWPAQPAAATALFAPSNRWRPLQRTLQVHRPGSLGGRKSFAFPAGNPRRITPLIIRTLDACAWTVDFLKLRSNKAATPNHSASVRAQQPAQARRIPSISPQLSSAAQSGACLDLQYKNCATAFFADFLARAESWSPTGAGSHYNLQKSERKINK